MREIEAGIHTLGLTSLSQPRFSRYYPGCEVCLGVEPGVPNGDHAVVLRTYPPGPVLNATPKLRRQCCIDFCPTLGAVLTLNDRRRRAGFRTGSVSPPLLISVSRLDSWHDQQVGEYIRLHYPGWVLYQTPRPRKPGLGHHPSNLFVAAGKQVRSVSVVARSNAEVVQAKVCFW